MMWLLRRYLTGRTPRLERPLFRTLTGHWLLPRNLPMLPPNPTFGWGCGISPGRWPRRPSGRTRLGQRLQGGTRREGKK